MSWNVLSGDLWGRWHDPIWLICWPADSRRSHWLDDHWMTWVVSWWFRTFSNFILMKMLWTTSLSLNTSLLFAVCSISGILRQFVDFDHTHHEDFIRFRSNTIFPWPMFSPRNDPCFSCKHLKVNSHAFRGKLNNHWLIKVGQKVEMQRAFRKMANGEGKTVNIQFYPSLGVISTNTALLSIVRYYTNNCINNVKSNDQFQVSFHHFYCSFDPSAW